MYNITTPVSLLSGPTILHLVCAREKEQKNTSFVSSDGSDWRLFTNNNAILVML